MVYGSGQESMSKASLPEGLVVYKHLGTRGFIFMHLPKDMNYR